MLSISNNKKQLTILRIWLMVFALAFAQWTLANHDHAAEQAVDENCQACLLTDRFDIPLTSDSTRSPSVCDSTDVLELHSISTSPFYPSNTARAPPSNSP